MGEKGNATDRRGGVSMGHELDRMVCHRCGKAITWTDIGGMFFGWFYCKACWRKSEVRARELLTVRLAK